MVLVGNWFYSFGVGDTDARLFLYVDGGIGIFNGCHRHADTGNQHEYANFNFFRTVGCGNYCVEIYGKRHPTESDRPLLNRRGVQYIGRVFNLYQPIKNGEGKIKVDDSIWKVHGEDCDINSRVKVVAVRGTVFEVEKVD